MVRGVPTTVVVMGVSGSGKTTVAHALASRLRWVFAEGDDFHPSANVTKMSAGLPLTDDDRRPWLAAIAAWIGDQERLGRGAVVTCSALRRIYRDRLRDGHPSVRFVHLTVDESILSERLAHRRGHFLPVSLLPSQLAAMEPLQADEPGASLPGEEPVDEVVARILRHLAAG
jgi:gluconokinase